MKPKVIAIGAGKGGVGKSSMTVSLAYALKHLGVQVGIIDADVYGPSLPIMVPPEVGAREEDGRLYPARGAGLELMSIAFFHPENHVSAFRAPIINATIQRFLHNVEWQDANLILIDLPPGTGDLHLTLLQSITLDGAIVVTTPQNVAISDVRKTLMLFQKMKVPLLGIIENMSYYQDPVTGERHEIFGRGGAELLQKEFSLPLLGKVPIDVSLGEALDQGRPVLKEFLLEIAIEIVNRMCDNPGEIIPIKEVDPFHVSIGERTYNYTKLQKHCPCARCEGRKVSSPDLTVKKIDHIGNYGLRFHFSSGCKQGIFTWDYLQSIL